MNGPKSLKGGRTVREGVSISGTAAADLAREMWRKTVWVVCSRMNDFLYSPLYGKGLNMIYFFPPKTGEKVRREEKRVEIWRKEEIRCRTTRICVERR